MFYNDKDEYSVTLTYSYMDQHYNNKTQVGKISNLPFAFYSAYTVEPRPQVFFFLCRGNAFVKSQKPLYGVLILRTADLEKKERE